jgi:hypothetical protein
MEGKGPLVVSLKRGRASAVPLFLIPLGFFWNTKCLKKMKELNGI